MERLQSKPSSLDRLVFRPARRQRSGTGRNLLRRRTQLFSDGRRRDRFRAGLARRRLREAFVASYRAGVVLAAAADPRSLSRRGAGEGRDGGHGPRPRPGPRPR